MLSFSLPLVHDRLAGNEMPPHRLLSRMETKIDGPESGSLRASGFSEFLLWKRNDKCFLFDCWNKISQAPTGLFYDVYGTICGCILFGTLKRTL
ncbi:hypothetical protein CDAR_310491 [Caerostris darwini]|uniref:Uncharacterized protein n=1 Tax=Caerostris darwini TaxID=1538125 RepID=A0AAV4TG15_9ARAC|nr:hypothetical protein CDAR_310491 [Caerostris darwini]